MLLRTLFRVHLAQGLYVSSAWSYLAGKYQFTWDCKLPFDALDVVWHNHANIKYHLICKEEAPVQRCPPIMLLHVYQ